MDNSIDTTDKKEPIVKKRGRKKIRTEEERKEIVRLKNQRYYARIKKARQLMQELEQLEKNDPVKK